MINSFHRLIAALFLSLNILPLMAQPLEPVSLQLKWKHEFQFAGFYMAKELGYYRDSGLDVEIREVESSTDVIHEVVSGSATYGLADSSLVYRRLEGKPVVLLSAIFQHSPMALIALKSSAISTPKDLLGKRVMTFDTESNISLLATLRQQNITLDDITLVPHSFNINDLIEGKVDAYAVYTSDQPFQLKERGIPYNLIDPIDYGFNFYGDILFTSESELAGNRERARRFTAASMRGWQYALDHIDETIDIILAKYNSQQRSRALLEFEAGILKKLAVTGQAQLGSISRERINSIAYVYRLLNPDHPKLGVRGTESRLASFIFREGKAFTTQEERDFLSSHRIEAISTSNWAPFNTTNNGKQLEGIAIDYWRLIQDNSQIRADTTIGNSWGEVVASIREKKSDVTLSTSRTDEREEFALFSKPYATFPVAIATSSDKGFISEGSSLNNKRVAVGMGYSAHAIMAEHFPEVDLVPVENIEEALKQLSMDQVYAVVDILPVLTYSIGKYGYSNIKIAGTTGHDFDVRMMVRDDYPQLVSAINKGIDAISEDQKKMIYNKWVAVNYQQAFDYSLLWKLGVPLVILLLVSAIWNRRLQQEARRRRVAEKRYESLASTDTLTKISNRYKIDNLLSQQISISNRYQHSLSIIFIDLDGFKEINDQYGHKSGDIVLTAFAQLLSGLIRASDYLGRWGGEEFMIILPETAMPQAVILADKLRQQVEEHEFRIIEQLTCSLGVTELKENDTPETLIARVDTALYKAKRRGKNRIEMV